jgi:hypothetical protein
MPQETFSSLQPIKGETFSNVAPVSTQKGSDTENKPGFTQRLLESFGVPGTVEQAEASAPHSFTDAVKQGLAASSGLLPLIYNYGRTTVRGAVEGVREMNEAGQNIGEGGPVAANLLKAGGGITHAVLQATPIVGPTIEQSGEDISQGNIVGGAGGLTGVAAQVFAPKLIEGSAKVAGKVSNAAREAFVEPTAPKPVPELPSPVSSPLQVDSALSDAVLRKLGTKDLTPGGRETLRNAAGPVVQAGSSPELHLIRAIPEINSTIPQRSPKSGHVRSPENRP